MCEKALSFEEISPFIRYSQLFTREAGVSPGEVKAYDYRLMYVLDGQGYFLLDGIKHEARRGHLFLWKPGIGYTFWPYPGDRLSLVSINFDYTGSRTQLDFPIPPDKAEAFDGKKVIEVIEFSDMTVFNKPVVLKNMQFLENRLLDMTKEYRMQKKFGVLKISGCFLSILADIAQHVSMIPSESGGMHHQIDLVIHYIHDHYDEPITNQAIGSHFNFHPVYINRLMVKYTGSSLHQYLLRYRISIAVQLLQTTDQSVAEIAYQVGFKDVNYFSKCFKKTVGLSPKYYVDSTRCII